MGKPRLDECLISLDFAFAVKALAEAMHLAGPGGDLQFRCPKCHYPVKPHREGEGPDGIDAPHFEHLPGHPQTCSYSYPGNRTQTAAKGAA